MWTEPYPEKAPVRPLVRVSSTLLEASWDRLDDLLSTLPVRQRVTMFGHDPRLEVPDDRLISSDLTDPPAIVFSAGVWAVGELRQQPARTTSDLVAAMQRERNRLTVIAADVSWAAVTVTPDTNDGYLISGPQRPDLLPLFHPIPCQPKRAGKEPGVQREVHRRRRTRRGLVADPRTRPPGQTRRTRAF